MWSPKIIISATSYCLSTLAPPMWSQGLFTQDTPATTNSGKEHVCEGSQCSSFLCYLYPLWRYYSLFLWGWTVQQLQGLRVFRWAGHISAMHIIWQINVQSCINIMLKCMLRRNIQLVRCLADRYRNSQCYCSLAVEWCTSVQSLLVYT